MDVGLARAPVPATNDGEVHEDQSLKHGKRLS
jgi:hypothetical protein